MNGRPRASRPTPGPCPGATGAPEGKSLIAFQLARSAHYIPPMQSAAIRRKFLDYFTAAPRSHRERSEEHTSELQSRLHLVCRLLLEKKTKTNSAAQAIYTIHTI